MPQYHANGRVCEVDADGFLEDPSIWTEEVAADFAAAEGIAGLTPGHWKVIRFLRNYFIEYGIVPAVRKLSKETGLGLAEICELFGSGPVRRACRLAGLPKPESCV